MADLVIRGMEMPKNCFLCRFFREVQDYDGTFGCCLAAEKEINLKFDGCPLLPLPEGHGRLIDAERFRVILCRLKERQNDDVAIHALNWAIECLDKLDTIVPAKGGGE